MGDLQRCKVEGENPFVYVQVQIPVVGHLRFSYFFN